jgi:hypothetical protein
VTKLVLHLSHNDPAALATVPALAERLQPGTSANPSALEVYVFGPADGALSAGDRAEFNTRIDALVEPGVRVTRCIGLARQAVAVGFPRLAAAAATVVTS